MTTNVLSIAGAVLAATVMSASAMAGECPADKVGDNDLADAATAPSGVNVELMSSLDLAETSVGVSDRGFRLRRFTIEPGGMVPLHDHGDRPSLIYIIEGTILEHNSSCTVPVEHTAGEAAMESVGLRHWWENAGDETVVLLSADLVKQEGDNNM